MALVRSMSGAGEIDLVDDGKDFEAVVDGEVGVGEVGLTPCEASTTRRAPSQEAKVSARPRR